MSEGAAEGGVSAGEGGDVGDVPDLDHEPGNGDDDAPEGGEGEEEEEEEEPKDPIDEDIRRTQRTGGGGGGGGGGRGGGGSGSGNRTTNIHLSLIKFGDFFKGLFSGWKIGSDNEANGIKTGGRTRRRGGGSRMANRSGRR